MALTPQEIAAIAADARAVRRLTSLVGEILEFMADDSVSYRPSSSIVIPISQEQKDQQEALMRQYWTTMTVLANKNRS